MRTVCKHKHRPFRSLLVAALIGLFWCADGQATGLFSSVDTEKPNPVFTQNGDWVSAKFIPRAKSTSVTVDFQVASGGTLEGVKGVDFFTIDRPEVDIKNFKSAAFEVDVRDVAPGGTVRVALRSDFFSMSTAFYVFNPHLAAPWIRDAQKENRLIANRVREIVIDIQDGGDRDADGAVNGRIQLIGGPRDSFWGYALGTLFIRFFGIFFVLTLLMVGMFASGWVFTWLARTHQAKPPAEARKAASVQQPTPPAPAVPATPMKPAAPTEPNMSEAAVAAIAAAIYLRDTAAAMAVIRQLPKTSTSASVHAPAPGMAWSLAGRERIMQERLAVFRQAGRR
ncbi:Sodium pump decarboxylase gamma subunit [Desulfosarcina cetonica]|uniref:hypothetical protein n=1 Tax=Desulfosarcina cetonica TaxID=90730 RepID=UPI0006D06198|nr:hypothetical protein [Desulfosarcina cetonica]VTR68131.1 Sodium pump decarboxylase gamma subunit [Desulfosarcina cetonica]